MAKRAEEPPREERGTLVSLPGGPAASRETWALNGAAGARTLRAEGEARGEVGLAWTLAAGFSGGGAWNSFEVQVRPLASPSEVTTMAFRCFGGRAFGTTIGPGGVPEKTETAFPPGSGFLGFSFALEGLVAASAPLRVGHGRRLVVVEVDTGDLRPRVRDWMLLAVAKERATGGSLSPWALAYEFRPADAPGRPHSTVLATPDGRVYRASRNVPGGTLDVRPAPDA